MPTEQLPSDQYIEGFKDALGSAAITCARCATLERRIAELEAQLQDANQVGKDYDDALCSITFNLHEPESAKLAQLALDKHAQGTQQ